MHELRHDPLRRGWVVVASERAQRSVDRAGAPCPFCPGNESETPMPTATVPGPEGWRLRAFPNRFPLVHDPASGPLPTASAEAVATGTHEVVVLSRRHDAAIADFTDDEAIEALRFLRSRVRALERHHRYVITFVNHGAGAGASRTHPHAQVVGLDVPFPVTAVEGEGLRRANPCPLCWHGRRQEDLIVARRGGATTWCPSWSSAPYELLVAPDDHRPRLSDRESELGPMAVLLRDSLVALREAADDPDYVVVAHSAPDASDAFHWHLHIWPRLQVLGGFELGTGLGVSTLPPEIAAMRLRAGLREADLAHSR